MYCVQEVSPQIFWVGGSDRRLERFENMFPLPNGISYNSYLILDKKTALLDTADSSISSLYLENVEHVLNGRTLDYLVINHMEPDHCANIQDIVFRYPKVKIVGNSKTFQFIEQLFNFDKKNDYYEVKEQDEICLGEHTLKFYFAPMVHWPEVMFTYETKKKILFSADAFGTFGALNGNIFSDEIDFKPVYLSEARRYYTNIVGKYGPQVQNILKKLSDTDINMICSLHGPIWRKNLNYILDKYNKWSNYEPEKQGVILVYASMYGHTENAVSIIANKLSERGVKDMRIYDVSKTHPSYIIADAWKYSNIVFGSPTYNMGLYYGMEFLIREMARLNFQKRKVSLIGNGTWANRAVKIMEELLEGMKNMEIVGTPLEIKSSMKKEQEGEFDKLAESICNSMK
ncbi:MULTISPECIES: FprA family A-type flavoprotein [Tissierellales]|uniref:FprA family A-type flavoprotein n=1 Tax=Acidilutibacter cellobiosedens TaxID=2507161 RepID=A0A410QES1_9FIRM|nr:MULTISPECIES: FprA family A-type flavoprotein [Tissierellales]QAT62419.1 FprA family A-type flavoprotein [Acidilutibacter cellobiosedens]SCL89169.1 H(2)O-forming NADH oxidase [Sporanaerobacter sp. PP17-6a]